MNNFMEIIDLNCMYRESNWSKDRESISMMGQTLAKWENILSNFSAQLWI